MSIDTHTLVVVKKRTPFDDNVDNIQHLTAMVKEQLATQEYNLKELNEKIRQQQQQLHKQQSEHSTHIVTGLNSRLMYATKQFQSVLQTRTNHIKQQRERRNMFTYNKPNFNRQLQQPSSQVTISIQDPAHDDQQQMNGNSLQLQQVNHPELQIQQNDSYIRQRSDEVAQIGRDMQQLSTMFTELGTMVKLQGELAARIDDNVSHAVINIEEGQNELLKYFKRISSNRGLVLKMMFVMVVFIIFIGVFVIS
jgi:syntaxin 5